MSHGDVVVLMLSICTDSTGDLIIHTPAHFDLSFRDSDEVFVRSFAGCMVVRSFRWSRVDPRLMFHTVDECG